VELSLTVSGTPKSVPQTLLSYVGRLHVPNQCLNRVVYVAWYCRCSWRQPTAIKKCYIVYTPVEPEASAKL
jgi:hypothetical protein